MEDAQGQESSRKAPEPRKVKEDYWKVVFSSKSNPNDSDDVQLMCNGETLIIQRERPVTVPRKFLEVADHATYPQFRQMPNEPRKVVSWIKTYPYTKLGESTEAEFLAQRQAGTKKLRADIKRYGYDAIPEQTEVDQEVG